MNSKRLLQTTENTPKSQIFTFAEFSFDAESEILYRGAEVVSIPPKTRELLGVFIENAGKVLSKEDLMNLVWKDVFVEEANLSHHIAVLRKSLGDSKNGNKFIQTIPRKGYRFIAEVNDYSDTEITEIIVSERTLTETIVETFVESDEFSISPVNAETALSANGIAANLESPPKVLIAQPNHHKLLWMVIALLLLSGAAFFVWSFFYPTKNSTVVTEIKIKRLTPDTNSFAPTISPDGMSIVFLQVENGSATLWRREIASNALTQLLPVILVKERNIVSSRFSPDGNWIYFKQITDDIRKAVVYRIGSSGGTPQKIAENVESDFSISPDGKQIAFTRNYQFLIVADVENGIERVISERNGLKKILRSDPSSSVAWSPDGSRLIFSASVLEDYTSIQQLWEINLSDGAESKIPLDKDLGNIYQIEWMPDESGLLITRDESWALPDQIWHISYPNGKTRRISDEMDDFDRAIRISADGKKLVAKQSLGHYNLWLAPIDDLEKRKQITLGAAAQHGKSGISFTPQDKIIYTSLESGVMDLWEIDQNGVEKRQISVNSGKFNSYPEVSRDGRFLVFNSRRTGVSQIWRTDVDGRNPVQLSPGVENQFIGLSPEDEVYYSTDSFQEKKLQFYKIPFAGGEPVPVDDQYYANSMMKFSPDGKWLLFYGGANADDPPRLSLLERATNKIIRHFDNISTNKVIGWSPDSKSLLMANLSGEMFYRQSLEGGEPQKLTDFLPNKIYQFDISADGKKIVFSLGNTTSEVVLIENYTDRTK